MRSIDIGDTIPLSLTTYTSAGVLTTPSTITLTVKKPDGTTTTPTVTTVSTGQFTASVTPDAAGMWAYEWRTTGTPALREGGRFYVRPSVVA